MPHRTTPPPSPASTAPSPGGGAGGARERGAEAGAARGSRERPRRSGLRRTGGAAARPPRGRRGVHPVDLARQFHALETEPHTSQADIARHFDRSPAYVSILCRVGEAIADAPPPLVEQLRAPHVTFRALRVLVARHKGARDIRDALAAYALGPIVGSRPRRTVGGARAWTTDDPTRAPMDPLPPTADAGAPALCCPTIGRNVGNGANTVTPDTFGFQWDESAARRDPAGESARFEAWMRDTVEAVVRRLAQAARQSELSRKHRSADVGRVTRGATAPQDGTARVVTVAESLLSIDRMLDRADSLLREHRVRMAAVLDRREGRRSAIGRAGFPSRDGSAVASADEVDEDLRE